VKMAKLFYPDFFNDVFGPVMQPGSSSAFAGPCRIGNLARSLIKSEPGRVRFLFNRSEREIVTIANFMSDRGYLGGVQGFLTDDIRLFDSHELARKNGITYDFDYLENEEIQDGSLKIEITGKEGDRGELVAASVGGGMVRTYKIKGFNIDWQSDSFGILVTYTDKQKAKAHALIFEKAYEEYHLSTLKLESADGLKGYFIEVSADIGEEAIRKYFYTENITVLPALLPVVTIKKRKPQLFKTVEEWRKTAADRNISFVQAAIEYEKDFSGWSDDKIWKYFEKIAGILYKQIHILEDTGYENALDTQTLPIYGRSWNNYIKGKNRISDTLTNHILIHAFSTNAKLPGTLIVPGPMGTGGGYLFSALDAVREERGYSHEKLVESLVVAAALGALAYTHTNASGEVGCVGESGVCCAMASGAVTWLAGGDGFQVENAASMALQANIGIPCDPIPGGLEFPCLTRTLRAAVTAPLYADLALSGIDPLIPYHEVLQAIEYNFSNTDRAKLCGPECGCNITETARACVKNLERHTSGNFHYQAD